VTAIEVELAGGPADGRRLVIPAENERTTLNLPCLDEPPPLDPAGPGGPTTYVILSYRRSGIRDDGTRIFTYEGWR
jgi:hypothetical protein